MLFRIDHKTLASILFDEDNGNNFIFDILPIIIDINLMNTTPHMKHTCLVTPTSHVKPTYIMKPTYHVKLTFPMNPTPHVKQSCPLKPIRVMPSAYRSSSIRTFIGVRPNVIKHSVFKIIRICPNYNK